MNKNSIEKEFLSDVVDLIEEEWIEYAADYNESSKIKTFPFYKFVNVAAVLMICIVSIVVFIQLSPINRIGEQLITTELPMLSTEPEITVNPVRSSEPGNMENPGQSDKPETTKNPESEKDTEQTYKPSSTVVPVPTDIYDEPVKTIAPTRQPHIGPTKTPVTREPQVHTPEPTENISNVVTDKPTIEPNNTSIPTPDPVPIPTPEPGLIPTPVPTQSMEGPNASTEPTFSPVVSDMPWPTCTVEPTPTPTPEPTETPMP